MSYIKGNEVGKNKGLTEEVKKEGVHRKGR